MNGNIVNGNKLVYGIIMGVAVLAVAGMWQLAIAQGKTETKVETVEEACKKHGEMVAEVPVIANEIKHIKETIDDIEDKQDEILDAINAHAREE